MLYKQKILYSVICRNNDSIIKECLNSILAQKNVNQYINVSCIGSTDKSFPIAKGFCKNPSVYEPSYVIADKIRVALVDNEKTAIHNTISYGDEIGVQYYCFMHHPCILNEMYSKRCESMIDEEIGACFTDILDTGINIYTSLNNNYVINLGPCFLIKARFVKMFSENNMTEFLLKIINHTVFAHIPETLASSDMLKGVMDKREDMVLTVDDYLKELNNE